MTTPHDLISGFAHDLNARNEENLAAIFTDTATVHDGGLEYRGPAAIRYWIQTTIERYALKLKILDVSGQDDRWLFDAMVSGSFEGSPVRLEHHLTIENGKIAHLDI
jgi:SnoaL-like domain